ncbi:MAG TPA: protein-methionine-sulfoxide reductase heme-binding subunit MsrQ [Terriglobales bacterium]|nr:protein-methionine-sulfoxide reductase heme-binding subunit MsrQ [Terriglobales bacterium]
MSNRRIVGLKVAVWLACLTPLGFLVWKGLTDRLGANPIEVITRSTGLWTLTYLMITLSITPLRRLSGQAWLIRFRRLVGLFAFFYGCLHLTTYVWLDQFFDVHSMAKDVYKRPFITAGFSAWMLMLPLALTSTAWSIRKLGGKKWQWLHRLIYLSASAGAIHFYWLVKKDVTVPVRYLVVLALLLGSRGALWAWQRRAKAPALQPEAAD